PPEEISAHRASTVLLVDACCNVATLRKILLTACGLLSPDLPVDVLVAVLRLVLVVRSAVATEIRGVEQVRRRDEAARRLAGERAVQLVDAHPSLQLQRLGDGRDLIAMLPDALKRRDRSIAR